MAKSTTLTPQYVVSAALSDENFAELADRGFKSVINFRPDGEASSQITSDEARDAAAAAGLKYAHIPTTKHDLFADETVALAETTLSQLPGPVLAFCASGQRAAVVWAAVSARSKPVSDVLQTLKTAGLDLEFLRDDLEAQADRARWTQTAVQLETAQQETNATETPQQDAAPKKAARRRERVAA
ncbi:MAG: TIGR01244 family phosphatase [Hyphomicrobium sp.]|nr:TIGR01244 family phosphatase [Hyphomicrobium sp.]